MSGNALFTKVAIPWHASHSMQQHQTLSFQSMKHIAVFLLIFITSFSFAIGQTAAEPSDLTSLREYWKKAREQVTAPLDKKYIQSLEALKLKYTKDGKLKEALTVEAELTAIHSVIAAESSRGTTPKISADILCKGDWIYSISPNFKNTYRFMPDKTIIDVTRNINPDGEWKISNNTLRMDTGKGKFWGEFSVETESGELVLRETDSQAGKREAKLTPSK